MPKSRRVEPFWLVLYDDDRKVFAVVGPLTDDTPLIDRISKRTAVTKPHLDRAAELSRNSPLGQNPDRQGAVSSSPHP